MATIPAHVLRSVPIIVACWGDGDDELVIRGADKYRAVLDGRVPLEACGICFVPVADRAEAEALLRRHGEGATQ